MTKARTPWGRLLLLFAAAVSLFLGLNAALLLLGFGTPLPATNLANAHGVLMVFGFLGTLIALERAVAFQAHGHRLGYVAPAASALAVVVVVAQILSAPLPSGRWLPGVLWALGLLTLIVVYLVIYRTQPATATLIQAIAAFAGLGGIALWARGYEVATIVPWWTAFLVLTIIGERLELARIAFLDPRLETRITAEVLAFVFALPLTLLAPVAGYILLGAALIVLVLDVATHDVARRLVHTQGLPRFSAAAMLSGYAWALVAGGIWLVGGAALSGYRYDTVVHALTIGFALSMVFAHAPIILPALARRPLPYSPTLWAAWGTLQVGLVVRVISGARDWPDGWQTGGVINVLAVLGFALSVIALLAVKKTPQPTGGERP